MLYFHYPWRSGTFQSGQMHGSFLIAPSWDSGYPSYLKTWVFPVICLIVSSSPFAPFSLSGTLDIVTSGMAVSIRQTSLFFPFMISIYAMCLCSALEMIFLIDLS